MWGNFMNWQQLKRKVQREFQKFMYGRYGVDQLTVLILVVSLVITVLAGILKLPGLQILYYVGVIVSLYRILSRDLVKRRKENHVFLQKTRGITSWSRTQKKMVGEKKTHRHFKCPNCKQRLRVPRGKGNVKITCTRCGEQFSRKT